MKWIVWARRAKARWKRVQLAAGFAMGTLRKSDAEDMVLLLEPVAGWYGVVTLCKEDVLEAALERYEPHAELADLCDSAASRVARKTDFSEEWNLARDFALDEVEEQARRSGITLRRRIDDDSVMQVANVFVDDEEDDAS